MPWRSGLSFQGKTKVICPQKMKEEKNEANK